MYCNYIDRAITNRTNTTLLTKDIDFGDPSRIKKIYNIYVTYRKEGSAPSVSYALNGSNNFTTISNTTFASTDTWEIEKIPLQSALQCQSIKIKIGIASTHSLFDINDISIDYRPIYRKVS